ncbi:MAG: hypothetical protein R3B81_05070 [bacterium]
MKRALVLYVFACLLVASALPRPSLAAVLTVPVSGVQVVAGQDGKSAVLLTFEAPVLDGWVSLGTARLRLGEPRVLLDRADASLCAIGVRHGSLQDLDLGQLSRVDVRAGAPVSAVDVTRAVRGVLSGQGITGLLITTPDRAGLDALDAATLRLALDQAVIEAEYRRVAPPRRRD